MTGIDMRNFLESMVNQLQAEDLDRLKYVLKENFTEDQLFELQTPEDLAIILEEENFLMEDEERNVFRAALESIGRIDLVKKFEIYIGAESHITKFKDHGYKFVCHMGNEDVKSLKQNVASIPRDNDKEIEIHGGAGEKGKEVFKVSHWKTKCRNYFNRYFKTSPVIVGPSDNDIIMKTLCFVCSGSKSRGFVFKNYNITRHMEFLGYDKGLLVANLGAAPTSQSISYIAYIEQKNVMFICEKVTNSANICQSSKSVSIMVKRFLTLYNMEIQASGLQVVGLLIRGEEKQEELIECCFCQLFSLSYEDFKSATAFNAKWNVIEVYEDWWNLADTGSSDFVNQGKQHQLFEEMAAEILCFTAVQEKGLPTLTDDKSLQLKQAYFIYTPQQMEIHFSNAKHLIIQGSYGSGKSLLGLKKLELISKNLGQHEKIIYINFDPMSNLHFLMEKNVKRYVRISQRKIKHIKGIREISKLPDPLIYVCHNNVGENLSVMLQETVRLNGNTSDIAKTNYHLIVEEYDGETLSHDEAAKIKKVVNESNLVESNIILLAQPLMKTRSCNIDKASYKKDTCMFNELKNIFKVAKLEEVLRCSNNICRITKSTQNFVQNKDSVFKTNMNKVTLDQQQQYKDSKKRMVFPSAPESTYADTGTPSKFKASINEVSNPSKDISTVDKSLDGRIDLDQAFERSATLQNSKAGKSMIVSKFGFLCEPKVGVDIQGLETNIVEFSKDISLTSDMTVISLALVLKEFIGKNKATTLLHMAEEQPRILRKTVQLLLRLLEKKFSYTTDIQEYLQKNKSKIIFSSSFRLVNGMEFDRVVIVLNHSEYYLKYYLPQAISRCAFDLTLIMLPKDKINVEEGVVQKLSNFFLRSRNEKNKETVADMIEELKLKCLVKQVALSECRVCESNCDCYSISKLTDNKKAFVVHTHSGQYKEYLSYIAEYTDPEVHGSNDKALDDDAKIQDFLKGYSEQQTEPPSISKPRMDPSFNSRAEEIDDHLVVRFHDAAHEGDVSLVESMLQEGVPVDCVYGGGTTPLFRAALNNRTDVIRLLLQKGADVNKQDYSGDTPIHWATEGNSTEAIAILIKHGASINITNHLFERPIDTARRREREAAVRMLEQL